MTIKFQNIGRSLRNLFSGSRKPGSSLKVRFVGSPEVYAAIGTEKAISEGYNGNSAVYAIVGKDARKFANIPQYLYKKDSEDDEILDNELSKLLDRPNDYEGRSVFREKVRSYRIATGEAIIWLNRGIMADDQYNEATGQYEPIDPKKRMEMPVLEMHVLPVDMVSIIPDPEDVFGIKGYYFTVNGEKKYIPKEDIIHWKNASLDFDAATGSHLRGRSPLTSGYKTLQQNNSATDAAVRMYQNDGAKGVLYNEDHTNLDPVQKAGIDGVIKRKVNSVDMKSAVANLPGKWGYLDLGKSSTDLDLLEGKKISMQELCYLFDQPYEFFDPSTTYANKEQAQKGWVYNTIMPACCSYDDELNRVLLKAFNLEGIAEIESDFDKLPELQEDMMKKVQALMLAWPIAPDEVREALGYEPLGGKFAEPWVPQSSVPLSEAGLNADTMQTQLDSMGLND